MYEPMSSIQVACEVTATIGEIGAASTIDVNLTVPYSTPQMNFVVQPTAAMTTGVVVVQAFGKAGGGKVTVRFGNLTAAPITPGSTTFKVAGI